MRFYCTKTLRCMHCDNHSGTHSLKIGLFLKSGKLFFIISYISIWLSIMAMEEPGLPCEEREENEEKKLYYGVR